jgi:pimeloyl-ACP methyl ester carboxylesterase
VPDAELHWLDRSSHFAQVDSPDRLAPLLARFLGA